MDKENNAMKIEVIDGELIVPLAAEEKLELIEFYYSRYYDTAQDTSLFATEFYHLAHTIYMGKIPCKLKFLSGYKEDMAEEFPQYREVIEKHIDDVA